MDIIEAAMAWRKSWVDVEDLQEEESGCNCELCQLIRACNQHAAQHHMHLTGLRLRENQSYLRDRPASNANRYAAHWRNVGEKELK